MPPSLGLPDRVTDLTGVRSGDQVTLAWSMPKRTTDKVAIKQLVMVRVCRAEAGGACVDAGTLSCPPGAAGSFTEQLPQSLAGGPARGLAYFVELKSPHGRSAGLSNTAEVVAGKAPDAVEQLSAKVRKDGVALHWSAGADSSPVRLERTLLTPAVKQQTGALAPPPEPAEQNLMVTDVAAGAALDRTARFGESYEYRAVRVQQLSVDGKTLELVSAASAPVRADVVDVFPPAVPAGLAAVASIDPASGQASIDLSWEPVSDATLAGYVVYRSEGDGAWQRLPGNQAAPAFHDAQVARGHSYRYAVSAVDRNGRESAKSAGAEETVPEE